MEENDKSRYSRSVSESQGTESSEYRSKAVQKILAKLPDIELTILTFHYLGEMTTQDISRFLRMSTTKVTSYLERARQRLQRDEEDLIREFLKRDPLVDDSMVRNVEKNVAKTKIIRFSIGKSLLTLGAFGVAVILVTLCLLGVDSQYFTRFQKPYSFEEASELRIEIIEASVVSKIDAKPVVRSQVERAPALSESRGVGSQDSEDVSTSNALVPPGGPEVWMPDPALRAVVREALGIPDDVPLTQLDMNSREALGHIESNLSWAESNLRAPQVNRLEGWDVETEVPDSPTNLRLMRVFTTMRLTHSDEYVLYTTGHGRTLLGEPMGEKGQLYRDREGLFIRAFTNGWAVYNRSGRAQHVELPEITTGVASGVTARLHAVPDLDGEIFLKNNPPNHLKGIHQ